MVGGSGTAIHVPDPVDPVDPVDRVDPRENSGKKCSFYVRGVAKIKILTLMLRGSRFVFCFSCSATLNILILVTPLR